MRALLLLLVAADWVHGGHDYYDSFSAGGPYRNPPRPPPYMRHEHLDMPACGSSAEHAADGSPLIEVTPSSPGGWCEASVRAGAVLEVACRAPPHTTDHLRWDDGDGWSNSECRSTQTCRLRLAVEAADEGARLTCRAGRHHLTVRLHLLPGGPRELAAGAEPKYLRRGDHWTDDSCDYSKLYLPRTAPGSGLVSYEKQIIKDAEIIRGFRHSQLDAVLYCVRYELSQPEPSALGIEPEYKEFRRKQDKFVLRLAGGVGGAGGAASEETQHVQNEQWSLGTPREHTTTQRAADTVHTSTEPATSPGADRTAAWVGGALGGVILVLLAALALLVWTHRRRRGQQQNVPYVVYTEVSVPGGEHPPPPPARAACPPYARVVGTLAAPDPPPREKALPQPLHHIYCTVK